MSEGKSGARSVAEDSSVARTHNGGIASGPSSVFAKRADESSVGLYTRSLRYF